MQSPSVLIALGPCLLMSMAAVALLVVYRNLSRMRHALIWSGAFATSAGQWLIMAAQGLGDGRPLHGGVIADLLGLGSILLLAEGFRLRCMPRRMRRMLPLLALVGGAVLLLTAAYPIGPARAAINPILSAVALGWSARLVLRARERASATELAVACMLGTIASIDAIAAALALAEQAGWLGSHTLYVVLYAATVEPACAAIALFILLLIAFDFARDLRRTVHTDPLTGVLNRFGFEHALAIVAPRRLQRARLLSLAIADIDLFKDINDRHGHAAGDAALTCVARHLSCEAGQGAHVARIGGEEFALLLPGISGAEALGRLDRLRSGLALLAIDGHPEMAVTASFGVAEHCPPESLQELMERADRALYQSKHDGRNRCTLAQAAVAQ